MARPRARIALVLVTLAACSSGGGDTSDVDADGPAAETSTSTSVPVVEPGAAAPTTAAPAGASAAPGPATTAPPGARPGGSATPTTQRPATTTAPPTTAKPAPPPGPTAAITIQNFTFSPPVLNIAPGTTVTATNRDGAPHTWTADDGSWDSGTLNQNGSYSRRFPTAGTFPYHCVIHPSMKATVNVS